MVDRLTIVQRDALTEIGNMAGGNAAKSLSEMINKSVAIKIPTIDIQRMQDVAALVGGPQSEISAIHMRLSGDLSGNVLLFFGKDNVRLLLDLINGRPKGTTKEINVEDASALKEIGNILLGSYLTAIDDFLEIRSSHHIRNLYKDNKLENVFRYALLMTDLQQNALLIKTEFLITLYRSGGYFVVLFDEKSLQSLLAAIDKKK